MTAIVLPEFAEDGDERAKVLQWYAREGEEIAEGQEILELLTDKAAFTLPAPCSGRLRRILVVAGAEVAVNQVLGEIEEHGG